MYNRTIIPPAQQSKNSFHDVNQRALPALPDLLRRWLPDGKTRGKEYVAKNPKRNDSHAGSFSINLRTGKWADFATGDNGGDVISLAAYLFNLSQYEAKQRIQEMMGV